MFSYYRMFCTKWMVFFVCLPLCTISHLLSSLDIVFALLWNSRKLLYIIISKWPQSIIHLLPTVLAFCNWEIVQQMQYICFLFSEIRKQTLAPSHPKMKLINISRSKSLIFLLRRGEWKKGWKSQGGAILIYLPRIEKFLIVEFPHFRNMIRFEMLKTIFKQFIFPWEQARQIKTRYYKIVATDQDVTRNIMVSFRQYRKRVRQKVAIIIRGKLAHAESTKTYQISEKGKRYQRTGKG